TAVALRRDLLDFAKTAGYAWSRDDTASYVSELFADSRAEFQTLVQRQLMELARAQQVGTEFRPFLAREAPVSITLTSTSEPKTGEALTFPSTSPARSSWTARGILRRPSVIAVLGMAGAT